MKHSSLFKPEHSEGQASTGRWGRGKCCSLASGLLSPSLSFDIWDFVWFVLVGFLHGAIYSLHVDSPAWGCLTLGLRAGWDLDVALGSFLACI